MNQPAESLQSGAVGLSAQLTRGAGIPSSRVAVTFADGFGLNLTAHMADGECEIENKAKEKASRPGKCRPSFSWTCRWREGEDLRLQALGGCFWFLFLRKFTIPAADVQRVEAVPARVRGSDVHVYTRNNGVLSLGFPNHQAPRARALVEALVANGARTPGGAG